MRSPHFEQEEYATPEFEQEWLKDFHVAEGSCYRHKPLHFVVFPSTLYSNRKGQRHALKIKCKKSRAYQPIGHWNGKVRFPRLAAVPVRKVLNPNCLGSLAV